MAGHVGVRTAVEEPQQLGASLQRVRLVYGHGPVRRVDSRESPVGVMLHTGSDLQSRSDQGPRPVVESPSRGPPFRGGGVAPETEKAAPVAPPTRTFSMGRTASAV